MTGVNITLLAIAILLMIAAVLLIDLGTGGKR